jgi:hypothetical protein
VAVYERWRADPSAETFAEVTEIDSDSRPDTVLAHRR